jgi:general secretion pathway protein D
MRLSLFSRLAVLGCVAAGNLLAQAAPPLIMQAPNPELAKPAQQNPPQQQQPQGQAPQTRPAAPHLADSRGFLLGGVSLSEMIDILAKMMKINYILDPRVKGSVTIYTYGEVKPVDLMPLMETILRVNGAAMVKIGDLYRIVPVNTVAQLPIDPMVNADSKTLPDDERIVLNLIFLKYATAAEMDKLLTPFYGEGASHSTYDPANLLIIQDNSRNMKRTMELINLFDSDTFAGQRVRLFDVSNSRPSDLVKELESVFKAYALSEKNSAVKFIPVDRINTLIAVAPNPGIFAEVAKWIDKLDIPVKVTAGAVNNYVYRLKYGTAETVAMAIMALYSGNPMAMIGLAGMMGAGGMGYGGMGAGGMGYGGMGYGGMGAGGMGYGGMGYGGMGAGGMGYGGMGYGGMGYGAQPYTNSSYGAPYYPQTNYGAPISGAAAVGPAAGGTGQTGTFLGTPAAQQPAAQYPHVIPNPFDNTLLVQGTPQDWEQIRNLLRQLDVPPRQVLIDAKIYEVEMTGAFSAGVAAYLDQKNTGPVSRVVQAATSSAGLTLSAGALVGHSKELLGVLNTAETRSLSRIISAPSIIATDSIPATMNVGQDVPVLSSSGVAVTGSSFNSVSSRSTGVTLAIMARVNSSGVVTMEINQTVSQPQANSTSSIDSPSFSNRSFSTQVTVQDGDTVAIGGFIGEDRENSSTGVPLLNRIPLLGAAFGSKSISRNRTELIIFLTPRVIYDTNQIQDATDEIRGMVKKLQKSIQEQ